MEAAGKGAREQSLAHAQQAWQVARPDGELGKLRKPAQQKFLTPRGYAVMGLVYAELARSPGGTRQDREEAAIWLAKSELAWQDVKSDSTFGTPQRRELQQVQTALGGIKNLHSGKLAGMVQH